MAVQHVAIVDLYGNDPVEPIAEAGAVVDTILTKRQIADAIEGGFVRKDDA
jgi:hypothetical protein